MLGVFWPATYLSDAKWVSFGQRTRKAICHIHFQWVSRSWDRRLGNYTLWSYFPSIHARIEQFS